MAKPKASAKNETTSETKSESAAAAKPKKATAAKKPAEKLAAKSPAKPTGGAASAPAKQTPKPLPAQPMIDTSFAAASAAKMLSAGFGRKTPAGDNAPSSGPSSAPARPESALFKQLKSGLNKPHGAAMNSLLDKTHGPGTSQGGKPFAKQVGHNQTIGSDAARTGVPRRTSG